MKYPARRRYFRGRIWLISGLIFVLLIVGGVAALRSWYSHNLRPVSSATTTKFFTVNSGDSVRQIADGLHQHGLIRNTQAFETYVRSNDFNNSLQAGTYSLNPSMSVQQIVAKMTKGEVAKNLITILPGKRIDEIKQTFAKAGYSQAEIDEAFDPNTYANHPLLADIPQGATLEGLLYPDSFQKEASTPAQTIIQESLDEMQNYLSANIIAGFGAQGLNAYQGITLASIIEQESDDPTYQPTIAQVFESRLKQGMMLQSNVTANYAADIANQPRTVAINSPYNTYLHNGLPPGPIGNMTISALSAVAHPSSTNYLFFVAGDDGKVHFSQTQAEHDAAVSQYCTKKCVQP